MKRNFVLYIMAACLLAFAACQQPAETQPDLTQVKSEIQTLENDWASAFNNKDLETIMSMYAEDAVVMPDGAPSLKGKAAIRQSQKKEFATMPSGMTYSFKTVDVYGDGKQLTEVGFTTIKNAEGKVIDTGNYICIWEKQDGKYVVVREIYNNDQQAAVAATKSIHLFDLPADVSEAEWSAALTEMNGAIAELGYPGAGYYLYKTEDEDTKDYLYYFEGVWPGEEAYAKIHDDPAFTALAEKHGPLYKKIQDREIYRRVNRVK